MNSSNANYLEELDEDLTANLSWDPADLGEEHKFPWEGKSPEPVEKLDGFRILEVQEGYPYFTATNNGRDISGYQLATRGGKLVVFDYGCVIRHPYELGIWKDDFIAEGIWNIDSEDTEDEPFSFSLKEGLNSIDHITIDDLAFEYGRNATDLFDNEDLLRIYEHLKKHLEPCDLDHLDEAVEHLRFEIAEHEAYLDLLDRQESYDD